MKNKERDDPLFGWYRLLAHYYDKCLKILFIPIGGERAWRQTFLGLIDPKPGERILELCCGTGTLTLMLAGNPGSGTKVQGIDLSPHQIKVAKRKTDRRGFPVSFKAQDAGNTDCPSSSFDKIVISGSLGEIRREKRIEIYEEGHRLLKPSGRFYISEVDRPNHGWGAFCFRVFGRALFPIRHIALELSNGGLERELEEAGFVLEDKRHSNLGIVQHLKLCTIMG